MNEPIDKEPDELEEIKEELRLYGDPSDSDNDAGWDLGREERYDKSLLKMPLFN